MLAGDVLFSSPWKYKKTSDFKGENFDISRDNYERILTWNG